MTTKPLAAIEKTNLVLALAVTALGGLAWGKAGLLAAGVGAALACLNLWAIHRLAARAIARAAASCRSLSGFPFFQSRSSWRGCGSDRRQVNRAKRSHGSPLNLV